MGDYRLTRREMMIRAGLLAGVGIVGPGALLEACAPAATTSPSPGASPVRGGKVIWALEQDPVYLAPFGGIPTSNHWGNEFMYDSLLEWDRNLTVKPALTESWSAPDDKTYIFKLKKGIKFHDGTEVTADDVKYSFDLMADPPPPGSRAYLGQFPKVAGVEVVDRYTVKVNMKSADAQMIGFLAWERYSSIVPKDMYKKVNPTNQGIGTGPFRLVEYVSNDHVTYERNPNFWKPGIPYLDSLTLKVLPDEQARVAALRSGAIDGATLSADAARTLQNDPNLTILKGLFAAHREIQFTIKAGQTRPWHDKRVRQAINHAINRKDMIDKVYGGDGKYSGHIPPGYGPWPLPEKDLVDRYLKFDLEQAKKLMADAGVASGFSVTMQAIAAPRDLTQCAEVAKEHLKQIKIDVTLQPLEIGTFAKNNGTGDFAWQLTARGMRGDANGFVAEFNPSAAIYKAWFTGWKNDELGPLLDKAVTTVDQQARLPMYRRAQEILMDEMVHVTLVQPLKYQVVRKRLRNMYVAYTDFNTGLREAWVSG